MTKEIERKLPALYMHEGFPPHAVPVAVKFFTPDAQCTWFITEGEREENGNWRFFGLCDLGQGFPELGYVLLSELEAIRGLLGLSVERDRHYEGALSDAMREVGYKLAARDVDTTSAHLYMLE